VHEGNKSLICADISGLITGKKAQGYKLKANSFQPEGQGNAAKLVQNHEFLRIILILPFSKHESSKTRLLIQRLNILDINWKTYLCRLKKTENQ
jgi:hypothetical protein